MSIPEMGELTAIPDMLPYCPVKEAELETELDLLVEKVKFQLLAQAKNNRRTC
jgi:hypothetical protein